MTTATPVIITVANLTTNARIIIATTSKNCPLIVATLGGHEFSEQDFLNPPEIAGSRQLDDPTRNEVVKSAYFTPTQDTHMNHDSTSDGNMGHNTGYSSSDSRSYSELPRQTSLLHRGRERRSHRHRQKEASFKSLSEKSQSDKSLSEMFSFAELDDHQLWSSSVPESRLPIPATEALGEEAVTYETFCHQTRVFTGFLP
ncbi:hypothetical protein BGZ67_005187 [Mortierella alpina]|nr:hypothetical protein BGZ67_005187 [Mortierella alpina]